MKRLILISLLSAILATLLAGCGSLLEPEVVVETVVVEKTIVETLVATVVETVVVEKPLNVLVDHQGHYLSTSAEGFAILDEVGSPHVKLLYDIYHQQISEGNLIATIKASAARIGHFHVADVPGRHEPGTGEINYANVLRAIDAAGYGGYVGLEYRPQARAADSLNAVKAIVGA